MAVLILTNVLVLKQEALLAVAGTLGIAFGFGIPMGFASVTGSVPLAAWVLLVANIFWAVAYDTEYAMVDRDDDLKIGIKTSAITFGRYDVAAIMLCYVVALALICVVLVVRGDSLLDLLQDARARGRGELMPPAAHVHDVL